MRKKQIYEKNACLFGNLNRGFRRPEIGELDFVELVVGSGSGVGAFRLCGGIRHVRAADDFSKGRRCEMSKAQDAAYELWELTLSISANGENEDAAKARWTPTGLDLPETTTLENVKEILRAFKAWETTGTVALADLLDYVKRQGWEKEVEQYLAQLEFDLSQVRRAQVVGEVPRALRHPALSAEHYWVVSSLDREGQTKWLASAVKHKLTGFELKRSIEAGKVLRKEQIEMLSGQNSGILTYQGILTDWKRWTAKVGGDDGILAWPPQAQDRWLEDTRPIVELRERVLERRGEEVAK